jgi:hypothetical protein
MNKRINLDEIFGNPDKVLELIPAYGRTYETLEETLTDWHMGYDFKIWKGPYCSKRDVDQMLEMGYTHVHFIYNIGRASSTLPLRKVA